MDMTTLARIGAQMRIRELQEELTELQRFLHGGSALVSTANDAPARTHWTQRPENRARVLAMIKKGRRTRKARS